MKKTITPEVTAKSIMNPSVLALDEEMTVQEAADFLLEHEISGAPVLNESGNFVGVLSVTDIAQDCAERGEITTERFTRTYYTEGWESEMDPEDMQQLVIGLDEKVVRDLMTPTVYTITEDTPVSEIAKTMIAGRVHRLFVTSQGTVVGIVTTLDLLKLIAGNK